jgi:hypothetical protein
VRSRLPVRPSYMPKFQPSSSCVLYLEGQTDAQSATIKDKSGYGNHGTITGATWVQLSSGLWVQNFDGTDDYITVTPTASLKVTKQHTIMLWFYHVTDENNMGLFGWDGDTADGGWRVINNATPIIAYSTNADGTVSLQEVGAHAIGSWIFYAFTYDGAAQNIYRDGVINNTGAQTGNIVYGATNFVIGTYYAASQCIIGKFGLFRVFSRAISATEIAGIYQSERHLFR